MLTSIFINKFFYLTFLSLSVLGLLLADWKYKIAFFDNNNKKATVKAIAVVMALLLLFDVLGIVNSIFTTNQSYVTGIHLISKNLPLEEFLFLFLLCYFCIILYLLIKNKVTESKDGDNV